MRRLGNLALILGIVLVSLPAAIPTPATRAEETANATPAAPGVTFAPVADGVASSLGVASAELRLDWARFAPGASHVVPLDDPSLLFVAVASGAVTVRSSAPLVVTRAAAPPNSGAAVQEEIGAGTEITLGPGDAFVRPANSEQDLRNSGSEPAVALLASVASELPARITRAPIAPVGAPAGTGVVLALALVVPPACPDGYTPAELGPVATPGGGGGGGGAGGVAVAIAAAPQCVSAGAGTGDMPAATPTP